MNITEKTLKNIDFNSTWWKTNNFNDERNIADVSIEDISLLSQKEEMSNEEEINNLYKQLFDEKSPLLTDNDFSKVPNKLNNTVIPNKLNTTFNYKSHLNDNLKGNL